MTANIMAASSALPQVLFSGQLTNVDATLYTCPASSSVKIANASICNVSGSAVTISLSMVRSGGTLDGTHRIVAPGYSLAAGDTLPLKDLLAGHTLGPGDFVAGYASVNSAADLVLSGTVFS